MACRSALPTTSTARRRRSPRRPRAAAVGPLVRRRFSAVIGSRANASTLRSAMRAIAAHSALELQVVVGASALLDRYGSVVALIRADGFEPAAELHMLVEGETPATMAQSTGLGLIELPTIFNRLKPDFVLTVGDRFETMATTL